MRKILTRADIPQEPIPGEVLRRLGVKILGPSDSPRTRMESADAELHVVQLAIVEDEDDELAHIQVPLKKLIAALVLLIPEKNLASKGDSAHA